MSRWLGDKRHGIWLVFVLLTSLQVLVLTQAAQRNRTLVVTGHPGELTVVDIGGHSYVEIKILARLVNGSLSFQGDRMVLTLPTFSKDRSAPAPAVNQPLASGFSKDFLKAGLEELADIREWREFLKRHKNPFEPVIQWMYGNYLKANKQPRGISSYNEVIVDLIAYYKKFGKI